MQSSNPDPAAVLFDLVLFAVVIVFVFRKRLRAWLSRQAWLNNRFRRAAKAKPPVIVVPDNIDPAELSKRLHELDAVFSPFGNEAAHPSALYAHAGFMEAVALLSSPSVPAPVVMQYVEGNRWGLACAALAALRQRPDGKDALPRVLNHCEHYYPWPMHFALELLFEFDPQMPVGAPVLRARDWWVDNRWMPAVIREFFERCAGRGDAATFGPDLKERNAALLQPAWLHQLSICGFLTSYLVNWLLIQLGFREEM